MRSPQVTLPTNQSATVKFETDAALRWCSRRTTHCCRLFCLSQTRLTQTSLVTTRCCLLEPHRRIDCPCLRTVVTEINRSLAIVLCIRFPGAPLRCDRRRVVTFDCSSRSPIFLLKKKIQGKKNKTNKRKQNKIKQDEMTKQKNDDTVFGVGSQNCRNFTLAAVCAHTHSDEKQKTRQKCPPSILTSFCRCLLCCCLRSHSRSPPPSATAMRVKMLLSASPTRARSLACAGEYRTRSASNFDVSCVFVRACVVLAN